MHERTRWAAAMLATSMILILTACNATSQAATEPPPALVEATDVEGINRVTLTARAAERLAVETDTISEVEMNGEMRKVAPYSSVIYDVNGGTWLYVNPEPLVFVREAIEIDYIEGDIAVLNEGPDVGTSVATVAVAELYGTDTGVGK